MRKTARNGVWVAVGAVLVGLAGVALMLAGWLSAKPPASTARPRNVLLITVDTLRADALGAYGNSTAMTPWLDRLAVGGLRFTAARAHNVVTLPSHANILAGRLPTDHGVRDNAGFRMPATEETIATRLKSVGYRTAAFVSAFPLDSRFGLARGFDVYDDAFVDASPRPAFLEQERAGAETVGAASRWLQSLTQEAGTAAPPWFLWVHLYEPHYPYAPPAPFADRYRSDGYAGEVAATDAALGPLLQPILERSAPAETLVILTSDHGEGLGDHGEATHGIFAYEATLKVPLIVHSPALVAPGVVAAPAGHVDILPTILDALGLPAAPGLRGRSLLGSASDKDAAPFTYFEALSGSLNRGWAPLSGLVADGIKYVDLPIPELYDLRTDPQEARNLAAERSQQVAAYRKLLASVANPVVRRADETSEVKERLRALGYVASSPSRSPKAFTDADDPKRLIGLETALQEIVGLSLEGRGPEALERARALVLRRPDMRVALLQLAHLEREAGRLPEAVAALRRALALNPGDAETASLLAAYLTADGKPHGAVALLRPYAAAADADVQVLTTMALAEARSGRPDDARHTLERARAQDPSNATVPIARGTVELMAGRRAEARAAFEATLALNGSIARAHSSLGALAAEEGNVDESLRHWQRAVALDPAEFEKLLAIGLSLARAGRIADARRYVQLFANSAPPSRYAADVAKARAWLQGERR
jgi:arylsulfatase A-like enzyme/Flp pilus assembly protein TadD